MFQYLIFLLRLISLSNPRCIEVTEILRQSEVAPVSPSPGSKMRLKLMFSSETGCSQQMALKMYSNLIPTYHKHPIPCPLWRVQISRAPLSAPALQTLQMSSHRHQRLFHVCVVCKCEYPSSNKSLDCLTLFHTDWEALYHWICICRLGLH